MQWGDVTMLRLRGLRFRLPFKTLRERRHPGSAAQCHESLVRRALGFNMP